MTTNYTFNNVLSRKREPLPLRHSLRPSDLSFKWGVYRGAETEPIRFGQTDYRAFIQRVLPLMRIYRQNRERLAAVALDDAAQRLLKALDRETSIKWEDISDKADADWSEASRAASILSLANLCEASPTRIRLSEFGDKMLAKSEQAD